MKLFNIAFSFLMLLGVVACDPMSDYQDELDRRKDADDPYKLHISGRTLLDSEVYNSKGNTYTLSAADYALAGVESYFSSEEDFASKVNEALDVYYGNNTKTVYVSYNVNVGTEESPVLETMVSTVRFMNDLLEWEQFIEYKLVPIEDDSTFDHEYTLTSSDYKDLCGQNYGNFDSSVTEDETVDYINLVIKTNRPNDLAEGEIWKANYVVWVGSTDSRVMYLQVERL